MTAEAIEALRADHGYLVDLADTFTAEEWMAPSACAGWSVRDLVGHMTQLFRQVVDPAALPAADPSGSSERTQDRWVEALRSLPVGQVLDEYRELGEKAIVVLEGLNANDTPVDLGDLGTHPFDLVANAFAFDHYTHLRVDLLAPLGPMAHPAPPATDEQLEAVMDWMVAGLPQMNAVDIAAIGAPVDLALTGPGGRIVRLGPSGCDATATVRSSTEEFVLWGTRRRPWRELDVRVSGDADVGAAFCDIVHVF